MYPYNEGRREHKPAIGAHVSRAHWLKTAGFEATPKPRRDKWIALRCRHGGYPQLIFDGLYHGVVEDNHLVDCVDPKTGDVQKFPFMVFEPCNPDNWKRWPLYLQPRLTAIEACN